MAKTPSRLSTVSINGVALECYLDNYDLTINQNTPDTSSLCDTGPKRVADNYDYDLSIKGKADFAAGASDATIFALVGDTDGGALDLAPTGGAAGPDDPHYESDNIVLQSYGISGSLGNAVEYTAKFAGANTLSRTLA